MNRDKSKFFFICVAKKKKEKREMLLILSEAKFSIYVDWDLWSII